MDTLLSLASLWLALTLFLLYLRRFFPPQEPFSRRLLGACAGWAAVYTALAVVAVAVVEYVHRGIVELAVFALLVVLVSGVRGAARRWRDQEHVNDGPLDLSPDPGPAPAPRLQVPRPRRPGELR